MGRFEGACSASYEPASFLPAQIVTRFCMSDSLYVGPQLSDAYMGHQSLGKEGEQDLPPP